MGADLPHKLVVCVTAHFNAARLQYLEAISSEFASLAERVFVYVVTNTNRESELQQLRAAVDGKGFVFQTYTPFGLGHPFLLPWSHFAITREIAGHEPSISHFLYVEDDILVTRENVRYWMQFREVLRPAGLIPSFVRVERKDGDSRWFSTDSLQPAAFGALPGIRVGSDLAFVNLPNPYQGMYLLDRELMLQHLAGPTSSPEFGEWGIREKAAQGVTFLEVPPGFRARNAVPFRLRDRAIDPRCLVHHLPNTYANDASNRFGKVPVQELIAA